jgi:hypothetical protein
MNDAEVPCMASLQSTPENKFGPQRKNLSFIVRGCKSAVTRQICNYLRVERMVCLLQKENPAYGQG